MWDLLNDPQASFDSLSELLTECKMSIEDYDENVEALSNANVILLKRDPKEVLGEWIQSRFIKGMERQYGHSIRY